MSCADFFRYGRPVLSDPSCNKVFTVVLEIGESCGDLDAYCESSDRESGYCVVRPCGKASCLDGQYCDPATNDCVPVKGGGASCSASAECDSSLGCHGGVCGAPPSIGAACAASMDCAQGSCQPGGATPGHGICASPLADGAACSLASECASGGCSFVGQTGGPMCGRVVCGAPAMPVAASTATVTAAHGQCPGRARTGAGAAAFMAEHALYRCLPPLDGSAPRPHLSIAHATSIDWRWRGHGYRLQPQSGIASAAGAWRGVSPVLSNAQPFPGSGAGRGAVRAARAARRPVQRRLAGAGRQ